MNIFQAFILGVVEGITEFIPVSSTGHLILTGQILGVTGEVASAFEIFIQLGAILAVVFLYRQSFLDLFKFERKEGFAGWNGLILLALTTLPALVFGAGLHGFIKHHLFNAHTVAAGLAAGGIAIILLEKLLPAGNRDGLGSITRRDALFIGLFQCLALWPGVSRSAATILGAMALGITRKTSAEYSFFAAVPVMFAATAFDLLKSREYLHPSDIAVFAVGFVTAFVSAYAAVRIFLRLVQNRSLAGFGWYRIAAALAVTAMMK